MIHVSGKPKGYLQTEKTYKNYVLRFDWKFPEPGQSGCFVHVGPPGTGWTEIQGMESRHGEIMGGAGFTVDREAQKRAIKPGEWNTTEITSKDGELASKVNGVQVGSGKGKRTEGTIGWQSEGDVVLFKNIRIKEMP